MNSGQFFSIFSLIDISRPTCFKNYAITLFDKICIYAQVRQLNFLFGMRINGEFYFASPLMFLPNLGECPQLEQLRRRFVLLATGNGRYEHPPDSWRMADVLGARGVPNRVDAWGEDWHHDWPTWRRMLPQYVDEFFPTESASGATI